MTAKRTVLAAQGDVNDVRTWSGTPYHLLQTAHADGLIDIGLGLEPLERFRQLFRYGWNLGAVLRGRGRGGYQFSAPCLERLWAPARPQLIGTRVINCHQLYAPSVVADARIEKWFYVDQTLEDLFGSYGLGENISPWMQQDAMARERVGYRQAAGIVTHSRWAAERVAAFAGLPASQLHVVVPGANLDEASYRRWAAAFQLGMPAAEEPLRLVFVGKDARRKGLDRLIRALRLARREGAALRLTVIGCTPERLPPELREDPDVHWRGFIDKQGDPAAYLDAVAAHDVGCLLSRAEAGGMCLREFHALGLAVIAPDVGGSPDHTLPEATALVAAADSDAQLAELLLALHRDRGRVQAMKRHSWEHRESVGWTAAVAQLAALWREDR